MLLIRYKDGRVLQAALLALGDQKIRVALKDSDDATEYRLVNQQWVSEDCEFVTISLEQEESAIVLEDGFPESMIPSGLDRPVARLIM